MGSHILQQPEIYMSGLPKYSRYVGNTVLYILNNSLMLKINFTVNILLSLYTELLKTEGKKEICGTLKL